MYGVTWLYGKEMMPKVQVAIREASVHYANLMLL